MAFIQEKNRQQLIPILKTLQNEVKLLTFTQEIECDYCRITRELTDEIKALSDKISHEVYDFVKDADKVKQYGIDKIPATVILGERDYGIRFYGIPAGYEFTTLIEDIVDISRRELNLPEGILNELARVDLPTDLPYLSLLCGCRTTGTPVCHGEREHYFRHGGTDRVSPSRSQIHCRQFPENNHQ
jgi:alkyl hydroperoxide reductase subunit AhpF